MLNLKIFLRKRIEIKYWKWIFKTATEILEKPLREQEIGWYGYYFDLDEETDKLFVEIECTMCYEYWKLHA